MRSVSILGSTGSIGVQALDVAKRLGNIRVAGLAAGGNAGLLFSQSAEFLPEVVSVRDENDALSLKKRFREAGLKTEVLYGGEGLCAVAALDSADLVLNAVVGFDGLPPTLSAINAGKDVALANKESLVAAGEIVMKAANERGVRLIPVDSEPSAILQCLRGNETNPFEKIYLTASGGPFRGKKFAELADVTPELALAHPTWKMGAKITVDCATLMNKGLEFIEIMRLFGARFSQIEILIHPQSVIHSMVRFRDGAVMAQLGPPDMRLPIQYALTYPERAENEFTRADFVKLRALTFEAPDFADFPCLGLALDAAKEGGALPAVLSAADEVAVAAFLSGHIGFNKIPAIIESAMSAYISMKDGGESLEEIIAADKFARNWAGKKSM